MDRMVGLRRGVWGWAMVGLCAAMASCAGEAKHSGETGATTREAGTRPAATMGAASQPVVTNSLALPTIFLAGDSTGANGDPQHTGWGKMFGRFVDSEKGRFVNGARGGRSSRIATKLDALGQEKATALYADQRVHTTAAGAELDAACVVEGLKALEEDPVGPYFRETEGRTW